MSADAGRLHDIMINGEPVRTAAATLAELLGERNVEPRAVATALNGSFVAAAARAAAALVNGDQVEIVSARQGG